jgi:hypothetical protein
VVQLHGVLGLALLLLAVAATREHLNQAATGDAPPDTNHTGRTGPRGLWPWVVLLVVPVAFHQLVLVKNDLFVGALTLVLSAWALTRVTRATWGEVLWAAWLAGLAVAVKLTSLPIAMVVAGATLLRRQGRWHAMTAVVLGGLIGAFAGGLVFGLAENVRVYGAPMPVEDIGGGTGSLTDVVVGFPRFALSLVDLGLFTRRWWPGRGGWGGTFGLPLVWALLVLLTRRDLPLVRRAAVIAGVQFLVFPIAFLDSDLAQRLVLGPGLLLIVVGIHVLDEPPAARALRLALWPVGLLSCAQIARSALLYLRT